MTIKNILVENKYMSAITCYAKYSKIYHSFVVSVFSILVNILRLNNSDVMNFYL